MFHVEQSPRELPEDPPGREERVFPEVRRRRAVTVFDAATFEDATPWVCAWAPEGMAGRLGGLSRLRDPAWGRPSRLTAARRIPRYEGLGRERSGHGAQSVCHGTLNGRLRERPYRYSNAPVGHSVIRPEPD
jgi:hypothetical protein